MKVLVLGGTGAMGVHLVKLLSESGVQTFVTSRRALPSEGNIQYLQGDAHNMCFLQNVLNEYWDVVVDFMVYNTVSFMERAKLLLESTNQYVFLSSARVYANEEHPITESSPRLLDISIDKDFLSTDEYSLTKARQEDILRNSVYKNWTIIRPYITYSENRLQLGVLEKEEWLFRALRGRTIVFSQDINTKFTTLTYGLDVSKAIIAIIGNWKSFGKTYHITTNESILWKNVLDIYLDVIENHVGFRPKVILTNSEHFYKMHPAKYQIDYDRLYNRQFDNRAIGEFIEVSSFKKLELGLNECVCRFVENVKFDNINWRTEAIKDKIAGERTQLWEIPTFVMKIKYLIYRYILFNFK